MAKKGSASLCTQGSLSVTAVLLLLPSRLWGTAGSVFVPLLLRKN